ncbi:uncharacterized protein [Dendropsophus ebraccatus]|uniref:uncharacterized protein n=1 Tax=Dendropsophus ebraccatus TaxID=150705 RepID=UPI0038321F11
MPGLRLSYWNPRLLRTVFYRLYEQQQAGLFCDVTLKGDGEAIHVHSCVIAACSPYFANLLDSKTTFSSRHVLEIHGVKSLHLFPLIHYMYTSELEVAPGDVNCVLSAAQMLQIPELELLKLEGGRLVRTEPVRRLNRTCLGNKIHTKANKQAEVRDQGIRKSGANFEIKPNNSIQRKIENRVTSACLVDVKQSNENTLDTGRSSCSMPEFTQDSLGFSGVLCSGRSKDDFASSDVFLESVPSSWDLLQYAPSNQNQKEAFTPCCDSIKALGNSQELREDTVITQKFVQDVSTNQNSPTDDGGSLDFIKYKLKGSLDDVPSHQDQSERRIDIHGLLDNVQSSQDTENIQGLIELPEHVQINKKLPDNMQDVKLWQEEVKNSEETPDNMQRRKGLPETGVESEDMQINVLNMCRTSSPKQSISNPEVVPYQEGECFVKCAQSRYCTKSLLKRIGLERKSEIALVDTESLECKSLDLNSNILVLDTFGTVALGLTSDIHCESETSGSVDHEGLSLSTHYKPETSATVDHEGVKSNTHYGSKKSGTVHQDDLPSSSYCESETIGIEDHKSFKSGTDYESKESGPVNPEDSPSSTHCDPEASLVYVSSRRIDESRKRQYSLSDSFETSLEKVKLRKANDGLSWEVVEGVESLNITQPIKEKEHLTSSTELEEEVQQMLNNIAPLSPDLDVCVWSPTIFFGENVWPDLSSDVDSDIEIDILG